jgi:hypothetical protein
MVDFFNENLVPSVTQETDASLVSLGQRGCVCVYDANGAPTGNFAAVQCITDCVFDALDTVNGSSANSPFFPFCDNGLTIPAGTILYAPFTLISATSGSFIAYKA